MKESDFIRRNLPKWRSFEKLSKSKSTDVDKQAKLFSSIIDDLNFSRTFFSKRSVRLYLNDLSYSVFNSITDKQYRKSGFARFWFTKLPYEVFKAYPQLIMAFFIFAVALGIGAISQNANPEFAVQIMGQGYIDMTEDNIANGDPFGVYKQDSFPEFFYQLVVNNTRVAIFAFLGGLLLGLGTFYILIYNGIMLGTFQMFLYQKGLFISSLGAVWLHGVFEISAIVISGAAGFVLANGLINPKSYSRSHAFFLAGRRASRIMLSMIPVFTVAALIESGVTPNYDILSFPAKMIVLVGSTLLLFLYVVVFPIRAGLSGYSPDAEDEEFVDAAQEIELLESKRFERLFYQSFSAFRKVWGSQGKWLSITFAVLFGLYAFTVWSDTDMMSYWLDNALGFNPFMADPFMDQGFLLAFIWGIFALVLNLLINRALKLSNPPWAALLIVFSVSFLSAYLCLELQAVWVFVTLGLAPLTLGVSAHWMSKYSLSEDASKIYPGNSLGVTYLFYLIIYVIGILGTWGINALHGHYLEGLIDDHFMYFTKDYEVYSKAALGAMRLLLVALLYFFALCFTRLAYFSGIESVFGLKFEEKVDKFGA